MPRKRIKIEDLDPNMKSKPAGSPDQPQPAVDPVSWRPSKDKAFTVFGLHWYNEDKKTLRRLPGRVQKTVPPPVWNLAQHLSGVRLRFKTNSSVLKVRIHQPLVEMTNMGPMGHSGIDLYVGAPDDMSYWGTSRPDLAAIKADKPYEHTYFEKTERTVRDITLYLPVYNSLTALDIGLDNDAVIEPPSPYANAKPIVFYGTSITQSGCASRPANGYVPMLGQLLNSDIINLGFSGNGRGEPELANLVADIDASLFVLDYEANAGLELMEKNLLPFAETIRAKHPQTPLVILSKPFFSRVNYLPDGYEGHQRSSAFFQSVAVELNKRYPGPAVFTDGWTLIGPQTPYAYVDGVHPNDYGFAQMASRLAPVLQSLLNKI
ncbi:MAG: SGNH/GDSL hydrolase family protein [Planctomycetota bacterium]